MIFSALLALQIGFSAENREKALQHVRDQMQLHSVRRCVSARALDLAEFSDESALDAAKYAVSFCSDEIRAAFPETKPALFFMEAMERDTAKSIVWWRVQARKSGSFVAIRAAEAHQK
jgi:hypothetical protein